MSLDKWPRCLLGCSIFLHPLNTRKNCTWRFRWRETFIGILKHDHAFISAHLFNSYKILVPEMAGPAEDQSVTMGYMSASFIVERAKFAQSCWLLAGGATLAVVLRLVSRLTNKSHYAADDLCISLSLLPLWSLAVSGVLSMLP